MPLNPERIQGYERLTGIFGAWPSFHDAEVLRLELDRRGNSDQVELMADVYVFEMTSNVTDGGFYELRNGTLVSLRFHGIADLELSGFNGQNALFGLRLEDISHRQLGALKWE